MESPDFSSSSSSSGAHVDASRPSLGFPLGTALLLIIIFSLSGIFSCCYHWDKLRSLRRSYHQDLEHQQSSKINYKDSNTNHHRQSLPVLMPGDKLPKFIALPCPCQPRRDDNTSAALPAADQTKPPVKPSDRLPLPLY